MFNNLLVPVSGDDLMGFELKRVAKLAKLNNAKITLVYVSDPLLPFYYLESGRKIPISEQEHRDVCAEFAKRVFAKGKKQLGDDLAVDTRHIFHRSISEGIIEAAKKVKADVIVMASHRRNEFLGFFLGNDAQDVIRQSKYPVLVL